MGLGRVSQGLGYRQGGLLYITGGPNVSLLEAHSDYVGASA